MQKESLSKIARRSNINHYHTTDNQVAVYEDHRTILNVLFVLKEKRNLTESLDLVMFDNHDDFCLPSPTALEKIATLSEPYTLQELNQIVEFDLGMLDDDWVKAGMELGLINNVFLFNSDESDVSFKEEYTTKKFGTKCLYNLGNVWKAIGYRGILNDAIKSDMQELWDAFGWELKDGNFEFKKDRRNFVFDIDLDCFSIRIMDKTIAIPEEIIVEKLTDYGRQEYHRYGSSQQFMKQLIKDSEVVTMCFENGCCGGIREAYKIFNMVDEVLFDNQIGGG